MSNKFLLLHIMEIANWFQDEFTQKHREYGLSGFALKRVQLQLRQIVYSVEEIVEILREANT